MDDLDNVVLEDIHCLNCRKPHNGDPDTVHFCSNFCEVEWMEEIHLDYEYDNLIRHPGMVPPPVLTPTEDSIMPTKITAIKLLAKLKEVSAATIVTVVFETIPKFKLKDSDGNDFPYTMGVVSKVTIVNGMLCADYEKAVNRQRGKEGLDKDFEAKPRAWGVRIGDSPIITHNDRYYLEMKVQGAVTQYFYNGNEFADDEARELVRWLPPQRPSRQGVEKEVVIRTYDFDTIRDVRIGGEVYKLK